MAEAALTALGEDGALARLELENAREKLAAAADAHGENFVYEEEAPMPSREI